MMSKVYKSPYVEMLTVDPVLIKIKKPDITAEIRKKLQDFLTDDVSSITSQFKKLKSGDKDEFIKVWNNFKIIAS
jgi:hypothetical protein